MPNWISDGLKSLADWQRLIPLVAIVSVLSAWLADAAKRYKGAW